MYICVYIYCADNQEESWRRGNGVKGKWRWEGGLRTYYSFVPSSEGSRWDGMEGLSVAMACCPGALPAQAIWRYCVRARKGSERKCTKGGFEVQVPTVAKQNQKKSPRRRDGIVEGIAKVCRDGGAFLGQNPCSSVNRQAVTGILLLYTRGNHRAPTSDECWGFDSLCKYPGWLDDPCV